MRPDLARAVKNVSIGALNLLIFYFLVQWCLENLNPALLLRQLHEIPLAAAAPTIALYSLALFLHALRLAVLVDLPLPAAFHVVNIGAGLNVILPFRLGELARLYYAKRFFALSAADLFASGLVEKFFDLAVIGGLAVALLLFFKGDQIGGQVSVLVFGLLLAAYLSILAFRRFSTQSEQALSGFSGALSLLRALRAQDRLARLPMLLGYTAAIWAVNIGFVQVAFAGFLPEASFGLGDAISVLLILALAVAIPSAPAGLGIVEGGIVAYLTQALQVGNEKALAAAIVFHLVIILPQLALMAAALMRLHLRRVADQPRR
jgi:hypothetical protein